MNQYSLSPTYPQPSKAEIKLIRSMGQKKFRDAHQLFLAEGPKVVQELMRYFSCKLLIGTSSWFDCNAVDVPARVVNENELSRISLLQTPQDVMALFEKPLATTNAPKPSAQFALALDGIQDPGNLGTIIRTADWFGIRTIYASTDTADCFAPKVVQATMGALGRVEIVYCSLAEQLTQLQAEGFTICGTFMQGENIYTSPIDKQVCIVMGNEGRGIREEVSRVCQRSLSIPRYTPRENGSESLNVAIATAIVCSEFRRRSTVFS